MKKNAVNFYSTYEALKLLPNASFVAPAVHFYSTYEALKQKLSEMFNIPASLFLLYLWGIETSDVPRAYIASRYFYSTYEALKPTNSYGNIGDDVFIFTLPMRHWNQKIYLGG